jgi:alkylation response protein AidB-like acyl-CoA dehydrogenase
MNAIVADLQEQDIIEEVTKFAHDRLRKETGRFDEEEGIPISLIHELGKKGYLGASLPKEYGGMGLDPVMFGLFLEQVGKACSTVRTLLTVHTSIVGQTLLRWGKPGQKKHWLPKLASGEAIGAFALSEPAAGSDARGTTTSYRKEGEKYIISGRKKWISFGDIADVLLLIAASEEHGTTAFLVERDMKGVKTVPIKGMMAGRATYMADIFLDNVEVPAENMVGKEGAGFDYIVNTALDHGRYSVAWAGVAIAQEALDAMVSYAHSREQYGKKIAEFQLVQRMIADAITQASAARTFCLRAGELRKEQSPDALAATAMAKYFCSGVAVKVTNDAVQVHGANGFSPDYAVERLYREAKALEIIEGSSEIQQQLIAKLCSRDYFKSYYMERKG